MPRSIVLAIIVAFLGLGAIGYTSAQDTAKPDAGTGGCATPAGSPVSVTMGTPADVPGTNGSVAASPVVGTPCASPSAQGGAAAAQPSVTMVDINFKPKQLTIPANTDVTIALTNSGAAVHNFNIDDLNVHSGDYQPGQTGTVTINAKPGTYTYYCNIPGHKDAGMVGQLIVQ